MPIRAEERHRYPSDWKAISARVRDEAGQKCEWCSAPNGELIRRGVTRDGQNVWRPVGASAYEDGHCAITGKVVSDSSPDVVAYRDPIRVVLTVAHLNHQPEDCARANLRALCQRCHLTYDSKLHSANAAATAHKRRAIGDLFRAHEDGGDVT